MNWKIAIVCFSPWIIAFAVALWHAYKTNPNNPDNHHK